MCHVPFLCTDGRHDLTEIQKGHEGSFVARVADIRHVLFYVVLDERVIVIEICIGLIEPIGTVLISSLIGNHAKGAEFGTVELIHSLQQSRILGIEISIFHSGEVKGLTDSIERNTVIDHSFIPHAGKWHIFVCGADHVRVNFVRQHDNLVLQRQPADA